MKLGALMSDYNYKQKLGAEFLGTAFLLMAVVGSGIMAERLAGGNMAIALLGNTIPTGAILVVLIAMLAPISGAHFNPAVSLVFALERELTLKETFGYVAAQIVGAVIGVWMAHYMFDETVIQFSQKMRTGGSQWFAEWVASFGLIFTILATLKADKRAVPMAVGLYITAAYWFTASTSFANPAVTVARGLSDTFAGIRPDDITGFIVAQIIGAVMAFFVCRWLLLAPTKNELEKT